MAIVSVLHPVPVRLVPRRSARERVAMVSCTTPVDLREVDPDAFEPMPYVPFDGHDADGFTEAGFDLHAFEGRLWMRMSSRGHPSGAGAGTMPRAEFLDYLAGRSEGVSRDPADQGYAGLPLNALGRHFSRTPVAAGSFETRRRTGTLLRTSRGGELPLGARVVTDHHDLAAAALARFMSEEVVLSGDGAFVRVPGPLAIRGEVRAGGELAPPLRTTVFPRAWAHGDNASHVRRFARACVGRRSMTFTGDDATGLGDALGDLDDDIALYALDLPRLVLSVCDPDGFALARMAPDARAAMLAAVPRLEEMDALGRIGVVLDGSPWSQVDELAGHVDALRGLPRHFGGTGAEHRAFADAFAEAGHDAGILRAQDRYLRDYVLPRISARETVADVDAEALEGLSAPVH